MNSPRIEVWQTMHLVGPGTAVRTVHWPGGAGKLILSGIEAAGSSAVIQLSNVGGSDWSYDELIPGTPEIHTDGIRTFSAPESTLRFAIELVVGDTLSFAELFAVTIGKS